MKLEYTRWFNVIKEPPVNGEPTAMYGWRCTKFKALLYKSMAKKSSLVDKGNCPDCQWRGLTRAEYERRGGK